MSILSEFFAATPYISFGVLGAIIFFSLMSFLIGAWPLSRRSSFDVAEGLKGASTAAVLVLSVAIAGWVAVLFLCLLVSLFGGAISA